MLQKKNDSRLHGDLFVFSTVSKRRLKKKQPCCQMVCFVPWESFGFRQMVSQRREEAGVVESKVLVMTLSNPNIVLNLRWQLGVACDVFVYIQ